MKFKNRYLCAIFFIIIYFCSSGFTVIGHRGDPTKYPEETIQSNNSAFNSGADYVELDLQLSKDGVPVIAHDEDLFRVTHTHAIVSQNDFQTLNQLQYDNGEHVISLEELFKYYQHRPHTKFLLETKIDHSENPSYELEDKIAGLVRKYHMENRIMIHSFSDASLFHFRKIMPHTYLILLVGSLKRINFSILPQVNAISASSDLIKEHPFFIHWLHKLNKQLYVWAEMDESPQLWNWLINKNIDGVVTNYPSTGFKYKMAKAGTNKYEINRQGEFFGKEKIPVVTNPYIPKKRKEYVYPKQKLQISYAVRVKDNLYYQIAEKTFIPAEFVSLDLTQNDIALYDNKQLIAKPNKRVPIYKRPENTAKTKKYLTGNTQYKIKNFNGSPKNLWIYTNVGWVKNQDILIYGIFSNNEIKQFHQLPKISQYTNLALLPYYNYQIYIPSFMTKLKIANN